MKHHGLLLLCSAALFAQPAPDSVKLDNEFVRVLFLTDKPVRLPKGQSLPALGLPGASLRLSSAGKNIT